MPSPSVVVEAPAHRAPARLPLALSPPHRHRMSDPPSSTPPRGAFQGPAPRVVFLAWTAYGLFMGMRSPINSFLFGSMRPLNPLWIVGNLLDGWYWALLTFPVFYVALRFRF